MTNTTIFNSPTTADLQGVRNMSELAEREGFANAAEYSAQYAHALCKSGSLDALRERFIALTSAAGHLDPDKAAASEIGQHYLVLQALFHKLIIQSLAVTESGGRGSSEAGERLLSGAFRAQRAAMACLSALKVLREAAPPKPPITSATSGQTSHAPGSGSLSAPVTLSGSN